MPTIGWTVTLDGAMHTVEVDHNWYFGQRTLRLDGKVLEHSSKVRHALLDRGGRHPVRIGQHECEVSIVSNWIGLFRYGLVIDGRPQAPTTVVPHQAAMMVNTVIGALLIGMVLSALVVTARWYLER